MKELQSKNAEMSQAELSGNQESCVSTNDTKILRNLRYQQTDIKESIDRLGMVLEFLIEVHDLPESEIANYVKFNLQGDIFLLSHVAKASRCLRDLLFLMQDEKGKK